MPQALPVLALALFQAGAPLWISNALVGVGVLGGIVGAVGQIALAFGVSALASAIFRPRQSSTKPEDVQQSLRIAISDRVRIYGQMQATGNWIFGESKNGDLHKVLVVCQGKLAEVLNLKVDDSVITVDAAGWSTDSLYVLKGKSRCRFLYRTGLPTETAYPDLTAVFPEWDAAHRGDGVVTIYATQLSIDDDNLMTIFPQLKDTLYRIEGRFTEVLNPNNDVTAWSDNAAGIVRDFMINADGMRIPSSVVNTPQAVAAWKNAWNKAGEGVALAAGGTEPRYRLWGAYKLSETPGSVLEAMLANCDGRPIMTRDGGVAIDIGAYSEPAVLLDKTLITACTSVTRGIDIRNTANVITAKYLSQADDYQLVDADPWIDEESVSLRGEITDDTEFGWTPSHSQARRLMKLRASKLTPEWQLTVNCRLGALAAFQERFVNVDYTIGATRIFGPFEILKFTWNIGDNGVLRSATLQLQSVDPNAYTWDASQEEGSAPVVPDLPVDNSIGDVSGFDVTVARRNISGTAVAYSTIDFDEPPSEALRVHIQTKKTSESNWVDVGVPSDVTSVDGPLMDDNVEYEFRARNMCHWAGREGPYTDPTIKLTPVADPSAPGVPTDVVATPGTGQVTIDFRTPNSANFSRAHVYRNTVNNFNSATLVKTVYGAPNTPYEYVDGALVTGSTLYYWVTAANASEVSSSPVATGAVTVL